MKLTREGCVERQRRFVEVLGERGLDGAIVSRREHVLYLTGFLPARYHAAALFIDREGETILVGADVPAEAAVTRVVSYEPAYLATLHNRQEGAVAEKMASEIPSGGRFGTDWEGGVGCVCLLAGTGAEDITGDLTRLRKRKLPDEVDAIRAAIAITEVMYSTARDLVRPGVDEVEVLAGLRAAATQAAGEDLECFGNDFRANAPGGAARRRPMQAGELYILDAGPCLHGYFADNCRTFAVGGNPTDAQRRTWERLDELFPRLEAAIEPGVPARDVFQLAHEELSRDGSQGLVHHLGHGIGLSPHEAPQLNPQYSAVFEAGDMFTMEPGLYAPELRAGIRLEENYLLTESGLERLTRFPRAL